MNKKHIATIKLTLLANKAAPSPLLGQALGQYGINIMEFCKNFNNQTKNIKDNIYIPTIIYLYSRDNFKVIIKTPTTSFLVKHIANILKGSSMAKKQQQGILYLKEIYHLAIFKKCDRILNHLNVKSLCKTIIGSIKSMGITVKKNN
jgi:large subunit ribosomal protein L11